MIISKLFLLICICLCLVSGSCRNENSGAWKVSTLETGLSYKDYRQTEPIDFFGLKLRGEYDDLLRQLNELPMLKIMEGEDSVKTQGNKIFLIVEFCGIPCGMTASVEWGPNGKLAVYHLKFITSQTDDHIIDKFVTELKSYYGDLDISDIEEDSYQWNNKQDIRARHSHTDSGGWTVYFI